jgi:hypothetical protein
MNSASLKENDLLDNGKCLVVQERNAQKKAFFLFIHSVSVQTYIFVAALLPGRTII